MTQSTSGMKNECASIIWSRFFFIPSCSLLQNKHILRESSVVFTLDSSSFLLMFISGPSFTKSSAGFWVVIIKVSRSFFLSVWKALNREEWSGLAFKYSFSFFLCCLDALCCSSCSTDRNVFLQGSHFQVLSAWDWLVFRLWEIARRMVNMISSTLLLGFEYLLRDRIEIGHASFHVVSVEVSS